MPAKKRVSGIGDVVKKVTNVLNIDECKDCAKRKDWLNINFPFGKPRKLTQEEKEQLEKEPLKIYNSAFNTDVNEDSFNGGVKVAILKKLNKLKEL